MAWGSEAVRRQAYARADSSQWLRWFPRGERPTRCAGVTSERIVGATGYGRFNGLRVFANPPADTPQLSCRLAKDLRQGSRPAA